MTIEYVGKVRVRHARGMFGFGARRPGWDVIIPGYVIDGTYVPDMHIYHFSHAAALAQACAITDVRRRRVRVVKDAAGVQ